MTSLAVMMARLRAAGVEPGDTDGVKLQKQLLLFAMGLMTAAPMFWNALYGYLGFKVSVVVPFGYQVISIATLGIYLYNGNFNLFRAVQQMLFLFFPFVLQWSMGNFVTASGVVLWGLLAPVAAVLLYSARESLPWFVAYVVLIAVTAWADSSTATSAVTWSSAQLRVSLIFFAINFIAMSSLVYFLLRFAAVEREKSAARAEAAHAELLAEQERSERLLLNILPSPVAERLKNDSGTIADGFADVTVMFADIVNFTEIAEGMSPNAIFSMLNKIFSSFDALAEQHGLEKIKTIGDAYMVAGGLNNDESDANYSEAIAAMALDMRDVLANDFVVNRQRLDIRVGIGTGPVVAGVLGKKKFIYDLWGDTVNIASRIAADGTPGLIQVDATTYRRIRGAFTFDAPRTVRLKGKGATQVYRLTGRHQVDRQLVDRQLVDGPPADRV